MRVKINNQKYLSTIKIGFLDKIFLKRALKYLMRSRLDIINTKNFLDSWTIESNSLNNFLISKKTKNNTLHFCIYKNIKGVQ